MNDFVEDPVPDISFQCFPADQLHPDTKKFCQMLLQVHESEDVRPYRRIASHLVEIYPQSLPLSTALRVFGAAHEGPKLLLEEVRMMRCVGSGEFFP